MKAQRELLRPLREPEAVEFSDRNRFFTLLAILKYLQPRAQRVILARRTGSLPVRYASEPAPFCRGVPLIARETVRAERQWLQAMLQELPW